ncbi:MAG: leucine-rich repeat domain-containing protein [Treponema sp.]|jgi:hypothetical protein|nr:leucine-rich repeat domain-containing protein [Treponema sp.]
MTKGFFLVFAAIAVLVFAGCGSKESAKLPAADTASVEESAVTVTASVPIVEEKTGEKTEPRQPAAETKPAVETTPVVETAPDAAPAAAGTAGDRDGFEYRIDGSGNSRRVIITGYTEEDEVITIPAAIDNIPVKAIGEGAFESRDIRAVTLPAGLTEIGPRAFKDNSLTRLEIPRGVTTIGAGAFAENSLRGLVIPQGVTAIADEAFAYNDLTELTLPAGLRSIGAEAFIISSSSFFGEPAKLNGVTFPSSLVSIGDGAFMNHNISELVLPRSVKSVGELAFEGNPIVKISIGSGVELERNAISSGDGDAFLFAGVLQMEDEEGNEISPLSSFTYAYSENNSRGGAYTRGKDGKWTFTAN